MKWDSFSTPEFAGLDNFRKMANDETFWISLKNTFLYTAAVVPGTLVCSLGLALLLNQKIRGMKLFLYDIFLSVCYFFSSNCCCLEYVVSSNDGTN